MNRNENEVDEEDADVEQVLLTAHKKQREKKKRTPPAKLSSDSRSASDSSDGNFTIS